MEKGFAAVAEDLADIKDRLTSVESKVAGTNRRLDMRSDAARRPATSPSASPISKRRPSAHRGIPSTFPLK